MSHKISIENLGPLKSVKDFEVKDFNLVIGKSSSGKSLLAKSIFFFNYIFETDFFETKDIKKINRYVRGSCENIIKDIFYPYKDYKIIYSYKKNHSVILKNIDGKNSLTVSKKLDEKFQDLRKKSKILKKKDTNERAHEFSQMLDAFELLNEFSKNSKNASLKEKENEQKALKEWKKWDFLRKEMQVDIDIHVLNFKNKIELGILNPIFLPSSRSFVHDFNDIRIRNLNDMSRFASFRSIGDFFLRKFSKNFNKHMDDFSDLKKKYNTFLRVDKFYFDKITKQINFSIEKQELNISEASSGQKESFPICLFLQQIEKLSKERGKFLIIEEPEAHLFPSDQIEIFKLIISAIKKSNSKVFITTHSPYMLMSANNFLQAGRSKKKNSKLKEYSIPDTDLTCYKLEAGSNKSLLEDDGLIDGDYIESVNDEIYEEFEKA